MAYGLKWHDVDFTGQRVTIVRTLSRTVNQGWKLEEPKTRKSRRTIPIPAAVIEDLKEHRKQQTTDRMKSKKQYNDMGYIFANEYGEPLHERNMISRHFKPLLKQAGLPDMRLYDLRHSCATLLLSAGENPKVVSERLGHEA